MCQYHLKKAMEIRILPNPEQKKVLQKWAGATENPNKKLRALLVSEKVISEKDSWLKDVPNWVRQGGVIQLVNAHITNFAKKRKNKDHYFVINFRSRKKAMTETMDFDKRAVKLKPKDRTHCLVDVYSRKLGGPLLLKDSQRVINQLVDMKTPPCDFKIQFHYKTHDYFLVLPVPFSILEDKDKAPHQVVSLDSGVRSFMTGYSPS